MDFFIKPERHNNVITVEITGTGPSVAEIEHEIKFGPAQVSAGSTFDGPPPFSLGTIVLTIRMDGNFRHIQNFDARNDPQAASKAQAYVNEMTSRIISAKNNWDSLIDTLSDSNFQA